jgi:lipoate-protein ligase A
VIGSAQVRQGNAFLQHGSMLLEDDQALVRELAGSSEASSEAPLARLLGRPVTFEEAASGVTAAARSLPGGWLLREELPKAAEERARFHASRFRSPAWTWDR